MFRHEVTAIIRRNEKDVTKLQNKIGHLETELATKESELVQERHVKEDLLNQSFAVAQTQDSERKYHLKDVLNLKFVLKTERRSCGFF